MKYGRFPIQKPNVILYFYKNRTKAENGLLLSYLERNCPLSSLDKIQNIYADLTLMNNASLYNPFPTSVTMNGTRYSIAIYHGMCSDNLESPVPPTLKLKADTNH